MSEYGLPDGIQIAMSVFQIRFYIVALAPFVPRTEEEDPAVGSLLTDEV